MRTLSEMVDEVRRLVNDTTQDVFGDPAIKRALSDSLKMFSRVLVKYRDGKRILRTYSSATSLVADQRMYDVPDDSLQINSVEYRESPDDPWKTAVYRPPENGKTAPPFYWHDAAGLKQVAIWPALETVSGEEYRYKYYRRPTFPSVDEGTFNDPTNSGTDSYKYPEELDSAIEYRAVLILLSQENLNTAPVSFFSDMYHRMLETLIGGGPIKYPDRQDRMYGTANQEEDS